MNILRLFVDNNIADSVSWHLVANNTVIDSGVSNILELVNFDDCVLEVYVDVASCSVFSLNIASIVNKKLSEELILGMLEDQLIDDVDSSKAVILRDNELVYVTVFNKEYYEQLLSILQSLNKKILFIQSFAYLTKYNKNTFSVFIDNDGNSFVRHGYYEYLSLDDTKPIPLVLNELLSGNEYKEIYIYQNNLLKLDAIITDKFDIPCILLKYDDLLFNNTVVWNLYTHNNNHFKLDNRSLTYLKKLWGMLRVSVVLIIILFLIKLITISLSNINLKNDIEHTLQNVVHNNNTKNLKSLINDANNKLLVISHKKGLYAKSDAIILMQNFFDIVSTTNTNSVTQINYYDNKLLVILNEKFDTMQFNSYKNIFLVKQLKAELFSYKEYIKNNKDLNNNEDDDTSSPNNNNNMWVIVVSPIKMLDIK